MFDKRRVFLSEILNTNSLDCIVSKVKIARVSPNVRGLIHLVVYNLYSVLSSYTSGPVSFIWYFNCFFFSAGPGRKREIYTRMWFILRHEVFDSQFDIFYHWRWYFSKQFFSSTNHKVPIAVLFVWLSYLLCFIGRPTWAKKWTNYS